MGVMDKFKDWFLVDKNNPNGDEYDGTEEEIASSKSSSKDIRKNTTEPNLNNTSNDNNNSSYDSESYASKSTSTHTNDYENNASNSTSYGNPRSSENNRKATINVNAKLEVVLVRPEVFTDAKQIADHLMKKKTVVLNLENAKPENKRRIIDFLAGVAYANGGSIKPVANLTYIVTPYGVGFVGDDLVGELESNGVIM